MNINIKYKYSIDYEIRRVLNAIKKIEWYKKNHYNITFPKDINLVKNQNPTKSDIRKAIIKEYKIREYENISLQLQQNWKPKAKKVTDNLLLNGLNLKKEYIVFLTKYGVGGSYSFPNKIIINYSSDKKKNLIKTIIHEIIHLSIESLIQKHKITHWQKERIVDLLVLKVYPEWKKTQEIPIKTNKIDKIFYKYLPDVKKIISSI